MSAEDDPPEIPEMKAVFNKDEIDNFDYYKIYNIKTNFQLNFSKFNLYEAQTQLSDILDAMQTVTEKDFKEQLTEYKVIINKHEFSFYELKALASATSLNKKMLRIISANAFYIFDHFATKAGYGKSLYKVDAKKNS